MFQVNTSVGCKQTIVQLVNLNYHYATIHNTAELLKSLQFFSAITGETIHVSHSWSEKEWEVTNTST